MMQYALCKQQSWCEEVFVSVKFIHTICNRADVMPLHFLIMTSCSFRIFQCVIFDCGASIMVCIGLD
jgi:hypothetical protein